MIPNRVWTTSRESFEKPGRSSWLSLREGRSCDDPRTLYVFTDGSTKGSRAAVFVTVEPSGLQTLEFSRWSEPTRTRNIGTEWKGFLLGLERAPSDARLTIVFDLLWLGAWLIGARKAEDPEVVAAVTNAQALIRECALEVTLVHHAGHQDKHGDTSDFTRFNVRADKLCTETAKKAMPGGKT